MKLHTIKFLTLFATCMLAIIIGTISSFAITPHKSSNPSIFLQDNIEKIETIKGETQRKINTNDYYIEHYNLFIIYRYNNSPIVIYTNYVNV